MMNGFTLRKMEMFRRLEMMGEKAKTLYKILDQIEFFTVQKFIYPFYGFAAFIMAFPALVSGGLFTSKNIPETIFFGSIFLTGVLLMTLVPFQYGQQRMERINEMNILLASDPEYMTVLSQLKAMDPDMARNIRRHIP